MTQNKNSRVAVGKLREYLRETKGKRAPIETRLKSEDNYIKNLYFKTLCMVQGYDSDGTEEQTLFLQRLMTGCGAEYDLLTYLRQGRELTAEEYEEFAGKLEEKGYRYDFVLDALLLVGLGGGSEEMAAFVAELCESLRVEETEMVFLIIISAALLRQDFLACVKLERVCPESIPCSLWSAYLLNVEDTVCFENSGNQWNLIAPKPKGINLAQYNSVAKYDLPSMEIGKVSAIPGIRVTGLTALLYNLEIQFEFGLFFRNFDRVDFINCKFCADQTKTHSNAVSICFTDCKKIRIRNCQFENFHGRTIYVENAPCIIIENSEFRNCTDVYSEALGGWYELGGVIHGNSEKSFLELVGCRFSDCGGQNSYNYCCSSVISNCHTKIFNCTFENCWHYYKYSEKDPSNSARCLFRHIVSESGNVLTNSAELGLH